MAMFLLFSGIASSQEELTDGPGLFTGESGELTLFKPEEKEPVTQPNIKAKTGTNASTIDQDEFELFKVWKKAKQNNTTEYQEFLYWMEYKTFVENQKR